MHRKAAIGPRCLAELTDEAWKLCRFWSGLQSQRHRNAVTFASCSFVFARQDRIDKAVTEPVPSCEVTDRDAMFRQNFLDLVRRHTQN